MEDNILAEIKQIRRLLSELVGTTNLPSSQKFSKEAISKAALEFRKLSIKGPIKIFQDRYPPGPLPLWPSRRVPSAPRP